MENTQNANAASGSMDRLVRLKFAEIRFFSGQRVSYMGCEYKITGVNFQERLIGLSDGPRDEEFWVREENAAVHEPNALISRAGETND